MIFQVELDPVLLVDAPHPATHVRTQHLLEGNPVGCSNGHGEAPGPERRRDLQPDEAGTHYHGPLRRTGGSDDLVAVPEAPEQVHVGQVRPRDTEPHRLGAGGQQQPVVRYRASVVQLHFVRPGIDGRRCGIQHQVDRLFSIELERSERDPLFLGVACEVVLGEVGPVVRNVLLHTYHRDPALETGAPQHLRPRIARRSSADDDDPLRRGYVGRLGRGHFDPVAHRNVPALSPDNEAGDRLESRGVHRLAGGEVEAGVVPGTAHLAIHQQPF